MAVEGPLSRRDGLPPVSERRASDGQKPDRHALPPADHQNDAG